MGLTDYIGIEALKQYKDTTVSWVSQATSGSFQGATDKAWAWSVATKDHVVDSYKKAKAASQDAIEPVVKVIEDPAHQTAEVRRSYLAKVPFTYRFNFLVFTTAVIFIASPRIRPRLFRSLLFLGVGLPLATPELNPFNRK